MIGRLLSGRYRMEEVVGTGGMAVVYRAVDITTDAVVAVKVLRPEFETDAEFVRRFRTEAEAAAKVFHENIVSVLDVGIDGDTRYIVMEYIEGQTLKSMIRSEGKIHPDVALRMAIRILAAVDHAHRNGIVHRDIKPQNILVDRDGRIKVADFGIARLKTDSVQEEGKSFASVHYFSPEQARGEVADEQSDLYSVGVVLYEMLAGHVPFDGDSPVAIALKHVNERPESLRKGNSHISVALDEVVARALAKDRAMRYQTAAEMAADLRKTLTAPKGGFVHYPDPNEPEPEKPESERENQTKTSKKAPAFRRKLRVHVRRAVLYGVGGITLMFAVIAILYIAITNRKTTVPEVMGKDQESAVIALDEAELKSTVVNAYSDEYPAGTVMLQSEEANGRVRVNTTVTLTVSLGTQWYEMPDMRGMAEDEATAVIDNAELVGSTVKYVRSEESEGTVISSSVPAGTASRDTAVTLLISGETVTVPNLVGMDLETAEKVLSAEGIEVENVFESTLPDAEAGTVIHQSIPADTQALRNSKITLIVCHDRAEIYAADAPLTVFVPMDNIRTVVELTTPSDEKVSLYSGRPSRGTLSIGMTSTERGVHKVSIYMDDVLFEELYIDFE